VEIKLATAPLIPPIFPKFIIVNNLVIFAFTYMYQ